VALSHSDVMILWSGCGDIVSYTLQCDIVAECLRLNLQLLLLVHSLTGKMFGYGHISSSTEIQSSHATACSESVMLSLV